MTEQHISLFYFLIYYSESFCLGKVKITNAMVLADRNVVIVARGEEGAMSVKIIAKMNVGEGMRG